MSLVSGAQGADEKRESTMFSVSDEFGNQITTGLNTYSEAVQVARTYLSAHKDAPAVEVYSADESWTLTRDEVLN